MYRDYIIFVFKCSLPETTDKIKKEIMNLPAVDFLSRLKTSDEDPFDRIKELEEQNLKLANALRHLMKKKSNKGVG